MKVKKRFLSGNYPVRFLALMAWVAIMLAPQTAGAQCRPGLVRNLPPRRAMPAAYPQPGRESSRVSIEWFGHAFFRLISPGGTRILTDPFSFERGYPIPKTGSHAVTIGKETTNHSGLEILGGKPLVIRGLKNGGLDWAEVDHRVGDVRILSVPIVQGSGGGDDDFGGFGKGASFLFEMGGLCIAHLGDLAEPMNPSQLRRLGKVHVALVVLSPRVSMGAREMAAFVQRLGPQVAIPMHFYDDEETLAEFLRGFRRVRRLNANRFYVSRRTLPRPTEIVVLQHN